MDKYTESMRATDEPHPYTPFVSGYHLMLTYEERMAFEWVGPRYTHGDDMMEVLFSCMTENQLWSAHEDLYINIPEHKAWEIKRLADQGNNLWDCFSDTLSSNSANSIVSPGLKAKMRAFCDSII